MRWFRSEYLLKGVYLGLLLYAALRLGATPPGGQADALARANLPVLAGFGLALVAAAALKARAGYRVRGRVAAFVLFLLLESPTLVYGGVLAGALVGIWLVREPGGDELLAAAVAGGAGLGLVFNLLRSVRRRDVRVGAMLALAAGLVAGGLFWLGKLGDAARPHELASPAAFGWQILLGIPFFYLLTFAGHAEESEVEVGAVFGLLSLGLSMLTHDSVPMRPLGIFLPVLGYFWYTLRVLPSLRVLKHAFRGLSYARLGRTRPALQAFRRALQIDPNNKLAREGFWNVHRTLDPAVLAQDPETLALVDLDLCLDRVGALLLTKPTPAQAAEAGRLLDLVTRVAPDRNPPVDYWRAVASTHAKQSESAAAALERVLDPGHYGANQRHRRDVLMPAWRLALSVEDLRRRVGVPQLALPGRRMEAILAADRHLAANPEDADVAALKRMLYHEVTETEYDAHAGAGRAAEGFDHEYVQQLGLALINDEARWRRGVEYLRLAARGLPALGPTLFLQAAQAHERAGHADEARHAYESAKRTGQAVGAKHLAEAERQAYFGALKWLARDSQERGDLDAAVAALHLYAEAPGSGVETLRTLADLYERKGDPLGAARVTDQALVYNAKDKDLLARKERYYYSVLPEQLTARLESAKGWFDADYCVRRARAILDGRNYEDAEWLDVAHHLLRLARVLHPDALPAKLLSARVLLRYGRREEARTLLEEVRGPQRPERFASGEDEEAWYAASQFLGDLYLEGGRPGDAVACLQDFRKSSKSGAKTLYKLGQAYEQLGDVPRAVRCYQQVTAYEGNPLRYDAQDALQRLGA